MRKDHRSIFWICLLGLLSIGVSEQYTLNRQEGRGIFDDEPYNDPIGEFTEHQRRTAAYGAKNVFDDYNTDESNDESEAEENDSNLKKWFLNEIDKHRNELEKSDLQKKKVDKEVNMNGETEEDKEALRREEEKNKRQKEAKKSGIHPPLSGQLFEGDIVMTDHFRNHLLKRDTAKRDALKYKEYLWAKSDDGLVRVPYDVHKSFAESSLKLERLKEAVNDYEKYTCIRFVPRDSDADKDYVQFISNKSQCYSTVGKQGGKQSISIGDGCERKGTVIHEMLHSIGFIHEQSRPDRDRFVKVLWDNIRKDLKHNFEKYPDYLVTNLSVKYDFDSVLHYHNSAFSKNGEPTLIDKQDPDRKFGQRIGFSKRNIEQVNKLYDCNVDPQLMDDLQFE